MRVFAVIGRSIMAAIDWIEVSVSLPEKLRPVLFKGPSGVHGDRGEFYMSGFTSMSGAFLDTLGQPIREFRPTHWAYLDSL